MRVFVIPIGKWYEKCSFAFDVRNGEMSHINTVTIITDKETITVDVGHCVIVREKGE